MGKKAWRINTGFKELPFYLAGVAFLPILTGVGYLLQLIPNEVQYFLRGLSSLWVVIPFAAGFGVNKYFRGHLRAFCWGSFLGVFLLPLKGSHETLLSLFLQPVMIGAVWVIGIGIGGLAHEVISSLIARRNR